MASSPRSGRPARRLERAASLAGVSRLRLSTSAIRARQERVGEIADPNPSPRLPRGRRGEGLGDRSQTLGRSCLSPRGRGYAGLRACSLGGVGEGARRGATPLPLVSQDWCIVCLREVPLAEPPAPLLSPYPLGLRRPLESLGRDGSSSTRTGGGGSFQSQPIFLNRSHSPTQIRKIVPTTSG